MNARKPILAILTATLGVIAFASTPALAAKEYLTPGTPFGSEGAGNGQFKEPTGVAVNASTEPLTEPAAGDVYVADTGNNRVEQFSSAGVFVAAWGWGVANGKAEFEVCTVSCKAGLAGSGAGQFDTPEAIAVDNGALSSAKGEVYVGNSADNVVEKFSAAGAYLGQLTEAGGEAFGELHGLTVDSSGHLWVYHGEAFAKNIAEFSTAGVLEKTFEIEHGLGPGIAVDAKGGFYVDRGNGTVLKYDAATGSELGELAEGTGARALAVNPSTSNLLVDEAESNSVALYPPFAEPATPLESFPGATEPLAESQGVAVGADGTAYVSQRTANNVVIFEHSRLPRVITEPASFVAEGNELLHGSVNVEGKAATACAFQYASESSFDKNLKAGNDGYGEAATAPCVPSATAIPADSENHPVQATVSGLELDINYHFRLAAASTEGEGVGADTTFYTSTRPLITGESFSGLNSTQVDVSARVQAAALATSYEVDYGTVASGVYGSSTPKASVGGAGFPVGVLAHLSGLRPATEYHLRVVATNALGPTQGEVLTFTTAATAGSAAGLPDDRAYEMVSPPDNRTVAMPLVASQRTEPGEESVNISEWPFRASADGGAVAYIGEPPVQGGNGIEPGGFGGNEFLARRTAKGWQASDITPAPSTPNEEYVHEFYEAFSSDLSLGIIRSEGPRAGEGQPLAADGSPCDSLYSRASGNGAFVALFTESLTPAFCGEDQVFAGVSADKSQLLFQSRFALTGEADEVLSGSGRNLYAATGGHLRSVNVLNDGTPAPNATFGSPEVEMPIEQAEKEVNDFSNVISADGSRVFWTASERHEVATQRYAQRPEALYVRENDLQPQSPLGTKSECTVPTDACTVQLDAVQQSASGSSGGGLYWTASSDGSRVFFTDCSKLTADSTAVSTEGCEHLLAIGEISGGTEQMLEGSDLYEYDFNAPEGRRLTDLTVDHSGEDHLGADVKGVLGASEDGSYVYFVADGALAPGVTPRICETIEAQKNIDHEEFEKGIISEGQNIGKLEALEAEARLENEGKTPPKRGCNLYVSHEGESPRFIATLSPEDNALPHGGAGSEPHMGDWKANLGQRVAEVTPDGQSLLFESRHALTGYDNNGFEINGVVEHYPALEVFVYDAGSGRLSCASCLPSGAPPPLRESKENQEPLPTSLHLTYTPRWMSNDGRRVFFDTAQPLVAQDTNREQDVYEWEREEPGSAGCPQQTPARRDGGCVFVLSGGTSSYLSLFVDASASGNDVFFTTIGKLISQDHDENLKLYDAHVCTLAAPCFHETSLACEGTGCQGVPPAPPTFATPSSATFNGAGNYQPQPPAKGKTVAGIRAERLAGALKACRRKHDKHKRAVCERQAKKRYRAKSASPRRSTQGRK